MTPQTKKTLVRAGAGVALMLVLIWLMSALESVTTVIMVALILAYIFNPVVNRLNSWGIGRPLAAFLILFLGLSFFVILVLVLVPLIVREVSAFAAMVPHYVSALQGLQLQLEESFKLSLPHDREEFARLLIGPSKEFLSKMAHPAAQVFGTVFRSTLHVLSAILHILLVPIVAYYFLVSFENIKTETGDLVPPYLREALYAKLREIDAVLAGFIRGQMTIALIMGILYSLGFSLVGIDLAIVLGFISGLFCFVPFMGTATAMVTGSIMAFAKYGDVVHVLYIIGWVEMTHILEHYILTPRIVGHAVGLHPVVYILALITAAHLFGFVGLLVAIPVTAILKVLLNTGVEAYRNSYLYHDHPHESAVQ